MKRFIDNELLEPEQVADMDRLAEPERQANLLLHLRRDRQRQLRRRIPGGEIEQQEQDQADDKQRRNRNERPPDGVDQHPADVSGPAPGCPWRGPAVRARERQSLARTQCHRIRYQSAMFQISLSQVFNRTPPSECA